MKLNSYPVFSLSDNQLHGGSGGQPAARSDLSDGAQPGGEGAERLRGPEQSRCDGPQRRAQDQRCSGRSTTTTTTTRDDYLTGLQFQLR